MNAPASSAGGAAVVAGAASVVAVVGLAAAQPIKDTDRGWHVAQGERILALLQATGGP